MTSDCQQCSPGYSRRTVLKGAGVIAGAAVGSSLLPARYAFADGPGSAAGDVLVVLSLRGGFDGLSAVVPGNDPDYRRLRPGIGVPAASLVPLDGTFGLHPALAPLKALYDAGSLALVHAVGSPDPTRSHFEAQREMERSAFGAPVPGGWLDRYLAATGAGGAFSGVARGSMLPLSLSGPVPALAMSSLKDYTLSAWSGYRADYSRALAGLQAGVSHPAAGMAAATLGSLDTMAAVTANPYVSANGAVYDDTDISRAFRDLAQLIRARVGLRVACLDMGNWDMHKGLGRVDSGWMTNQLRDLGRGLAAFAADTGLAGVTVVTLSEFGRRAQENGSGGLDHGHGNAMFVLGGGVQGGRVYGQWPGLSAGALDQGDLAGTTDFRVVLGELLADRCGAGANVLGQVFPGWRPASLDLARPLG